MRKSLIAFATVVFIILATVPAALQPFNAQTQAAITQLTNGIISFVTLRMNAGSYISWGSGVGVNGYGIRDNSGVLETKNSGGTWVALPSSATLPTNASYWTRVAETDLTNETAMSALATALIVNTTATGVPVAYAGTSCTNQFPRSLSIVGAATCASVALATDVSGTLPVANGGTGLTSGTSGGILGFTASGTLASSSALTANALLLGGGAAATPLALGSLGTTITVLHGNAAGAPTFGAVALATDVSGTLSATNGGTSNAFFAVSGPAASTKTYTFPNASTTVLTTNAAVTGAQGGTGQTTYTIGDTLYASAATTLSKLAGVATGNALISGGVATAPSWGKIGLTTHITGTLGVTNGGTGFAAYAVGDLLYANSTTTLARLADVAVGQVLISGGVNTAPAWSATARLTSINLGSANLTFSGTAPTISAGFGTGASVTAGTASAFRVNVGTGGTATNGTIGLPTAATGWNCSVEDLTATTANAMDARTVQLSSTTTTAVVENQTVSTGAALAWTASDILAVSCVAF